ncbi:MAG TPA: hypothetical protein VKS60_16215 [Stellaceae bacterium]|nr:hypothetical protein [Stellaceae bacterium]
MAVELQSAMDRAELKRLLLKSKKEPVNCAVGMGDGRKVQAGLILLDRIKAPKMVLRDLEKQFPDATSTRFGTAMVDVELDATLVLLRINRAAPGIAKKLARSLRGTGFKKVKILLEDGSVAEQEADEEAAAAAPAPVADIEALTATLYELVKRLAAAAPEVQTTLKDLAFQAREALRSGDAAGAAAAIERLRAAIDAAGVAAAGDRSDDATAATYAKAGLAWRGMRRKLADDIAALQEKVLAAFGDHPRVSDIDAGFRSRVDILLDSIGDDLAETLDAAGKAKDPEQRATLLQDARQIIQRYQEVVAGDATVAALDANPFAPLEIREAVTVALSTVSKAIA